MYKYASSPDFEILLFGYSVDGGDVRVVDLAAGEAIPAEVLDALTDDSVIKTAHNSNFERVCLSRYLSDLGISLDPFHDSHPLSTECARFLNPAGWHCTMIWAAYMGLPLSLADTGAVLGLEKQKLSEGKDLIRYFCKPCEPTKTNGGRTRNRPADAPDKWALFKSYNLRDVETELEIEKRLSKFPVPEDVWDQYHIDQEINDRGIAIDDALVENAIRMDARSRAELTEMMQKLTNLDNPNSVQQMKQWLINNGMEIDSLGKKQVQALLQDAPPQLREVLLLRQQLAKSSVKKYIAMKNAVCADGRVRGMFQFYGAVRSGRWAGRLVQLQNLYRNSMPDLEAARNLVREGDYDTVKMLYGAVPDVLAELVRTAFIPRAGQKFIVSDFSAVEARVIAWLAGEQWRMGVFRDGGDIYCASASQMFKVPVEKHGVNGHLRQKGKIAELALGYGGSVGALKAMGALDMGLSEDELAPLVKAWRESNPNIVKLWWAVDDAVMKAIRNKTTTQTLGSQAATYMGAGSTRKWERIESYGPKFVENIVQGISRDLLCCAMQTLRCCRIVAHVHDELIIEADPAVSLDAVCEQMGRTPPWAEGLLLRADGYECAFYQKD